MSTTRVMLAELIGTFFLCFAGIAAILSVQKPVESGAGIVGIALAHGLALSVAVNAFGGVSGAHFNPAVSIALLITRRITPVRTLQYILAQLAGATLAAWACACFFPVAAVTSAKLGIPFPGISPAEDLAWVSVPVLLGVEFVLTFMLMTAIYGTAIDERGQAVKIGGFGIGLTVTFDILAGGAITGASMNPARSFGPTLVYKLMGADGAERAFDFHWCYWAAPIAGAAVAALIYEHVILRND
jgi:MIP family channel proteins